MEDWILERGDIMSTHIPQELIDALATKEVEALMKGLNDPEMCKNPAFLAKVRQFLKDNNFVTTAETDGVEDIVNMKSSIPDLVSDEVLN